MQTDAEADPETAAALDSALEEVERLDRLAVNLLVLARSRSRRAAARRRSTLGDVALRAR